MSNKLEFIQVGDECGDCTSPYVVKFTDKLTVKEFIDGILKDMKNDWGSIKIYSNDILAYYDISVRYRNGEIESAQSLLDMMYKDIGEKEIIGISAAGGWSRMDYVITI